jgi:hypothetical protein
LDLASRDTHIHLDTGSPSPNPPFFMKPNFKRPRLWPKGDLFRTDDDKVVTRTWT